MPIYEYECTVCKHRFERVQSFSEPAVAACPDCGGAVRKVLQPVGIVFKGSGWYKTDSRGSTTNGKADAQKDGGAESPAAKAAGEAAGTAAKPESADKPAASKPDASPAKPAATGGAS